MRLGKPSDHEKYEYDKLDIGGITVYRHTGMNRMSDAMNVDVDVQGESLSTRLVMRAGARQ